MATKKVRKYAQVVNPQPNPNTPEKNAWANINNATGNNEKYATSHYSVKTSTKKENGKKKTVETHNFPETVSAHRFGITDDDIPPNARLRNLRVGVRMKSEYGNMDLSFPVCGFMIHDTGGYVRESPRGTGWYGGVYWKEYTERKLTNAWYRTAEYEMSVKDFYNHGYTIADLKHDIFGVDLYFYESTPFTCHVYLMYVYIEVEFDVPVYTLTSNMSGTYDNPTQLRTGDVNTLTYKITQSTSNVKDTKQYLIIDIPFGVEVTTTSVNTNSTVNTAVLEKQNDNIYNLDVQFNEKGTTTITLQFIDYTVNKQHIDLINTTAWTHPKPYSPIPSKTVWFNTVRGRVDGYGRTTIGLNPPYHKRHPACFTVDTLLESNDDTVVYRMENLVYTSTSQEPNLTEVAEDFVFLNCDIDSELTDSRISITDIDYENHPKYVDVTFQVPRNERVHLGFTFCLLPLSKYEHEFVVTNKDSNVPTGVEYYVDDAYTYHIGATLNNDESTNRHQSKLVTERISFRNHRIASELETGAFILKCHMKDTDATMIQDKPSIRMYKWQEVDYIGCVPLEHLHFDPKSTYKDKLLDSHYKNKRYMGKELASDEDITLNVRVHPQQVTTLQGLIDMDKPIPINANHRCFEGDALNHRGCAEIYSIKAEKTNPHWYKCDIDVKYLTHNLNTRFHIKRGDRTFSKYSIPSLYTTVNESGTKLASDTPNEDFFTVDTDGTYKYIDDDNEWIDFLDYQGDPVKWVGGSWSDTNPSTYTGTELTVENDDGTYTTYRAVASKDDTTNEILEYLENLGEIVKPFQMNENIQTYEAYTIDDALRNRFTLDEGQHISIKSKNALSSVNQIEIQWGSSKLSENQENMIRRITRLIDSDTGDIVFEYEYCDFDFSNFKDYIDSSTDTEESLLQCRVIGRKKNNADYDVVIDDIIDLQSDVETVERQYQDEEGETVTDLKYYGSSLIFELNNSHLKVTDKGKSGREIEAEIDLEGKKYYWETFWENYNTGGENDDIIAYFDVIVQDTVLQSKYSDTYGSMYVSPFPVNGKQIIFSRDAEEGIIYYLKEDNQEFSYIIDPYYTYHNGVDLRASYENGSAISIFNLNYGYKVVYLQNGLVSLGINRLNGQMYLGRYDKTSKSYITLFTLHLNKFNDVNINSISDDRIELQASDTVIIMYRGHPYVIFRHPTEDIGIDTKSYMVYGQSVDGQSSNYPLYFDLMNHDNLLPDCVTRKLDDDCVNLVEKEITGLTDVTIKLVRDDNAMVYEGDEVSFSVTDDEDNPFEERTCYLIKKDDDDGFDEVGCNSDGSFEYTMTRSGAYQVIAVYVGDDTHTYAISNELSVQVGKPIQTVNPLDPQPPVLTGDYKLTMNCADTMHYRDNKQVMFTLTKGGVPVSGKTIEMIDFTSMNSRETNSKGQAWFYNHRANTHPKTYKIGARFYDGERNKPTKSVFKDVKVKKGFCSFHLVQGAKKSGGTFTVKLKDAQGNVLAKRKVQITVNGKKYDKTTNSKGNVNLTMNEKGWHKYTCVFNGDSDYYDTKYTYRETVK